jgi:hypothetical protein
VPPLRGGPRLGRVGLIDTDVLISGASHSSVSDTLMHNIGRSFVGAVGLPRPERGVT